MAAWELGIKWVMGIVVFIAASVMFIFRDDDKD
jgi:hypothetical protein